MCVMYIDVLMYIYVYVLVSSDPSNATPRKPESSAERGSERYAPLNMTIMEIDGVHR